MKITDYSFASNGGILVPETKPLLCAQVFPEQSSLEVVNEGWVRFNPRRVGNRVISSFVDWLEKSAQDFLEEFWPTKKVVIDVEHRLAINARVKRNQVSLVNVLGQDGDAKVCEKVSEAVGYICANILESQPELVFATQEFDLSTQETHFLKSRIDHIRSVFSGKQISEPFGVETVGENRRIQAFRGRFDLRKYESIPPKPCEGLARVDGFRESGNVVYLTTLDAARNVVDDSREFLVTSTLLIEKAIQARAHKRPVKFGGLELYDRNPKKPIFHLQNLAMCHE